MGVLAGKTAIVTGAGRGVGHGIASALAKEGASLVVVDLLEEELKLTGEALRGVGAEVVTLVGDVGTQDVVDETIARAKAEFGHVDILVNNAQSSSPGLPFADHQDRDLEICLHSGVWATFRFMRACFPEMRDRGGRIVNIGSPAATHGKAGFAGYAAAKEAIRGLTKVGATEWGPCGITVNCICPSASTEASRAFFEAHPGYREALIAQTPMRRIGHVEDDIGRAIVFLAGPDAGFITGMTLMVNGGATIYP
jgi:NAD(P)-dependent dehydrogenase (short-subunit alcohol dehydrogenase family)